MDGAESFQAYLPAHSNTLTRGKYARGVTEMSMAPSNIATGTEVYTMDGAKLGFANIWATESGSA